MREDLEMRMGSSSIRCGALHEGTRRGGWMVQARVHWMARATHELVYETEIDERIEIRAYLE